MPQEPRTHRRFLRVPRALLTAVAGALLVGLGCPGCSHAPLPPEGSSTSTGRTFARPAPELGIVQAAEIAPGVYRGGQPTQQGLVNLRNRGFKTVVNLRSHHSERSRVEALGMKAVEIPMQADIVCEPPSEAAVFRFLDTVLDPANQPVFFHCAHGCDRAGTMSAVYRMEVDGWAPREALEEMRAFGCAEYYGDLIRYVANYRAHGRFRNLMRSREPAEAND